MVGVGELPFIEALLEMCKRHGVTRFKCTDFEVQLVPIYADLDNMGVSKEEDEDLQ
jgi:hypothetical protein